MEFLRSAEFMEAITTYAESHEKFQQAVYTAKDNAHDLLDELDWEAFTLRIKHDEGYAIYKALVEGTGFHTETAERQKRLNQATKATRERQASRNKRANTPADPSIIALIPLCHTKPPGYQH